MKSLKLREVKPPAQGHMASTEWTQDMAAYSVTPKPVAAWLHSLTPTLQRAQVSTLFPASP